MSAQNPSSFTEWWQNLPIPWLVAGTNGSLEAASLGNVMDQQVSILKQAAKVIFPDYAPTDALPHIGGDRSLVQGPAETNNSFATRIKSAWTDWGYAGTFAEMLVEIFWTGIPPTYVDFIIVQQNGLLFKLASAPTAGADPTTLLTVGNLGTLGSIMTPAPLYSSDNPNGYTKFIPAGNQWWTFDSKTDFCSRFAVLFTTNINPTDAQIAALQIVMKKWRRASQTCVGVYSVSLGSFWGYPVETWGSGGVWGPSIVATLAGTWQ